MLCWLRRLNSSKARSTHQLDHVIGIPDDHPIAVNARPSSKYDVQQTYVIILTKNDPVRRRYELSTDLIERVSEEVIEDFEPYSRVLYVNAIAEAEAQRKLFDYMREHHIQDWWDLPDQLALD